MHPGTSSQRSSTASSHGEYVRAWYVCTLGTQLFSNVALCVLCVRACGERT
jgi:hypothetical protein